MRVAPKIELNEQEREELLKLAHSKVASVRLVQRARIVLLAGDGLQNKEIAELLLASMKKAVARNRRQHQRGAQAPRRAASGQSVVWMT